jgi:DNA-binding CsgD family transcriptional regulator
VIELAVASLSGHDSDRKMAFEIVGREGDLASVRAFVAQIGDGPSALILEGEAGIGKSILWLTGVEHARSSGVRVLVSRPAEAERGQAHVGLSDLFDDVVDELAPELSPPRRRAFEVALLREDPSGDAVDHRALGVAVRDALQLLSERDSVLIAIDDLQWLDASSSSCLAFALRRLAPSPVLSLLARRLGDGTRRSEIERALGGERLQRLPVGPLSIGAIHRLLLDRLGRPFPRQTLLRIHEASGGNPFFALELARVLALDVDPLEPLPVPETLDELVRARLAGLPAATRDALALAAAVGTPSRSLLERAGVAPDALEPAVAAHVVEYEERSIRFTHPLLSSVLYQDLGEERRSVHERIAGIVEDPLLRARHLALSRDAADDRVADVLEDASTLAAERGASALAAELAGQALRLTSPDASERHPRALAAARANRAAGEWTWARMGVTDLLAETDIGALRAEALVLLAELDGLHRSVGLLEEALLEAQARPALRAKVHCQLAVAVRFEKGFHGALEHARASLELADDLDDDALRVGALAMLTFFGCAVGDVDAPAHASRAYDLATAVGQTELLKRATRALADVLDVRKDVDAARALLEPVYHEWQERDELWTAELLAQLAWVELWGGRWQLAADYAAGALDINVQYGLDVPWNHLPIAVVAAHRGQLEVARAHSELALRLGEEQIGLHTPVHLGTLGLVALRSGDPHTAVDWFGKAERQTARLGWREATRRWWIADHAEALLELGRVDDAVRVVDVWGTDAAQLGRDWVLAHVTRCRGLVAAARGEVDQAASLLERAVAQHQAAGDPFGEARALLALGVVRRRERQKRAARDTIALALGAFERLGAATWIEKARGELGRIGGRTREEGLTAAERRVAALVAEGRTNKEVAAALFLSERTIENHLTHVYAKLGVRSRAELARTYRAGAEPIEQSSGGLAISS